MPRFLALRPLGLSLAAAVIVVAAALLALFSGALSSAAAAPSRPLLPALTPTATTTPQPCGTWQVESSPNQGSVNNSLASVAVVSPTDVWAVGYFGDFDWQTLTERWDGTQWNIVPSPNQGTSFNQLTSVAAVSADDVWAVGYYSGESSPANTLIEHWDGSQWRIVPSPGLGNTNELYSVSAVSTNDVWAVGFYGNGVIIQTLVEHWDGTQWTTASTPNPSSTTNYLRAVTAISANDVWIVGYYGVGSTILPLIEHWDGALWSVVPGASQGAFSALYSVAAVSPTDVWATGYYYIDPYAASYRTLVEHWDGTQWSIVPSPNQANALNNWLYSVTVVSPTDVWAAGSYYISQNSPIDQTLVEHWDGTQWSIVPSPNQGTGSNELLSVAASFTDLWAVGYFNSGLVSQTLVERYELCQPVPTPTATGIPPTFTPTSTPTLTPAGSATPVPPTATVSPTPCAISFSDVHPSDYFYEAVSYLYCHGAVSGYSDGTFRPYNNTTRGQLSKIVVLAEGWPIVTPTGTPTFSDVPPTHPFYQYAETAVSHGIISGYSDGTFRPGNDVTRGQLCKIVVLAEGWTLLNPPVPTFTDVLPGSAFYQYVETAYSHGIVSGYSDHTFRPGNSATRGQISKIVYLAVTSGRGSGVGDRNR